MRVGHRKDGAQHEEARLTTIEQVEPLLSAGTSIGFSAAGNAGERYEHLCRFLKLKTLRAGVARSASVAFC